VYDNERLFMATFPLIAVLAGISLTRIAQKFSRGVALDRRVWAGIIAMVIAIPISQMTVLWPHLLSFYSTSIGALPGARAFKMDHTYWSSTYRDVLVYLDDIAPPNATVWIEAWSFDVPQTYQRDGIIRDDLRFVSDDGGSVWGMPITRMPAYEADYVLVTYRFAGWTPATAALVRGSTPPVFLIERAGVPLAALYRNP
ncbi:MAG: glycosyl transferase, partial [Roseiflexaceae bacterium]